MWDPDFKVVRTIKLEDPNGYIAQQPRDEFKYGNDYPTSEEASLSASANTEDADKPKDYDDIVNKEIKSEDDGMYHWENNDGAPDDDELVSSSDMIYEDREKVVLGDLDKPGSYVVVATGGQGGIGNSAYAKRQFVPNHIADAAEKAKGQPGKIIYLELELKLIADVGLVGFPNAGKSSLLAAMSKAQPAIAPYPVSSIPAFCLYQ